MSGHRSPFPSPPSSPSHYRNFRLVSRFTLRAVSLCIIAITANKVALRRAGLLLGWVTVRCMPT